MLHAEIALLDAVAAFYRIVEPAGERAARAMLDKVVWAMGNAASVELPAAPQPLPASALLLSALERVGPSAQPLATALRRAAPRFHWRQNPNYNASNMGATFMAGYGYVEFVGPKEALFHATDVRAGLLVLGPGLHYPPHAHPAEEVYHPLTEGGEWRRGDEAWRTVPAGSAIHHPPMIVHETRAGAGTLLALYCWIGETGTEARMTPA